MFRIHFNRILSIAIIWLLLGLFLTAYDWFLLKSHLSTGHGADYTLTKALQFNVLSGFFGGLMGGTVLTVVNRRFRTKPFYAGLTIVILSFILIISIITFISAFIPTILIYEQPFTNPEAKAFLCEQILNTMHLKNILFWAVVVAMTHFSVQVANKFGPGNLWKILTGKYHSPKLEDRVFMFLDLKSSTSIAEELGGERYHQFLKDIFSDITDPIINARAEIYQYVGDEVVISWSMKTTGNVNDYLNCFFAIQEELINKQEYYKRRYDHIPQFKAGAHYGQVVAGEVGIIKRDITYSGDVLNTTARIQSLCNQLNTSFLISKSLYDYIQPNLYEWSIHSTGLVKLRGKEFEHELFAVKKI